MARVQNPGRKHQRSPVRDRPAASMQPLLEKIVLVPRANGAFSPDLFDGIAWEAARNIATEDKKLNKTSQLRKFYNELLMWEERVNGGEPEGAKDRLARHLPLIRMLNAKAAYAQGREHVGENFVSLLRRCLEQVEDNPESLRYCRLFFEAFMGFYKVERSND